MTHKVERYSRDYARIVNEDGAVVAGVGRLSNGTWAVFDTHDNRLSKRCFATVPKAFDWWLIERYAASADTHPKDGDGTAPLVSEDKR